MKRRIALAVACLLVTSSLFAASAPVQDRVLLIATAPVGGTNAVQTLYFGVGAGGPTPTPTATATATATPTATPLNAITGGTCKLKFTNRTTAAITWSATNATLVANVDAALEALPNIGVGGVTTAVGTMTDGIGSITVTFNGTKQAKLAIAPMTVDTNSLTGSYAVLSVLTTTPGVTADGRTEKQGTLIVAADTGHIYVNTAAPPNPVWVDKTP